MSKGHIVVQGAMCKCKFGNTPDTLVVQTQTKGYVNDSEGSQKLIGNTMDIGMPLQAKTFGQCKLQPSSSGYLPCIPAITQWQDPYENVVLPNNGKILTEKSKAICAISGSPCVEFTWHGQTAAPAPAAPTAEQQQVHSQLNPLANAKKHQQVTTCLMDDITSNQERQAQPSIKNIGWLHDKDDQKIVTAEFGQSIRIFIQVKDINLEETITLNLYAKSGGNFEAQPTKTYSAKVEEYFGGTYAIFHINIDPKWEINSGNQKNNSIDTIFAKVSYNNTINKDFSAKGLDLVVQKLKGIYLQKGNDEAYYYNGKLYSATTDKKGMTPYTEKPRRQFRETVEAIDRIASKPKGKKFIDDIIARSNPYFIEITRKKGKNSTKGKTVSWAPGDNHGGLDEHGNTKREPFISLVHELWHAWENWTLPNMPNPIWVNITDINKLSDPIYNKELTASQFENKIRVEHKIPRRKWYVKIDQGDGTYKGIGKIF
jgi:hypothetical protein